MKRTIFTLMCFSGLGFGIVSATSVRADYVTNPLPPNAPRTSPCIVGGGAGAVVVDANGCQKLVIGIS